MKITKGAFRLLMEWLRNCQSQNTGLLKSQKVLGNKILISELGFHATNQNKTLSLIAEIEFERKVIFIHPALWNFK